MKIEPFPELTVDPLFGEAGYRVQTALTAGACSNLAPDDGCPPNSYLATDIKGNASCAACEWGAL